MWTDTLLEILRHEAPESDISADQLRSYLQSGFPWHTPDQPHLDIKSADQWWGTMHPTFERAYERVGFDPSQAQYMAKQVRRIYADPERWRLFGEAIPTLDLLLSVGWTHVVLSNHVPELREIILHLRLGPYIASIFNSAETGYEKPHPCAFRSVLKTIGGAPVVWMIGDNYDVDIVGAESVGTPSILVRTYHKDAKSYCPDLSLVPTIVMEAQE